MLQKCYVAVASIFLAIAAMAAPGQSPTPAPVQQNVTPAPVPVDHASPIQPAAKFKRWIEIENLALNTRYRYIDDRSGRTVVNQQQYQVQARGRFKFDREGRFTIYAGIFTGSALTSGWDNTGLGTAHFNGDLFFKQLYFDAKPAKWLEFQIGGLGVNNGESTEITGYDNDAYITGERLAIRRPKDLYFDEISATNAYIGDLNQPNVFRRFRRLNKSSYHQFFVRKQVNRRFGFSADYTFEAGRDTLHQALKIKAPEIKLIDTVHFENYQRVDPDHGYGFAIWGEKTAGKKLNLSGGFARIDRSMLNGDRYQRGNRLFVGGVYKLSRELSVNPVFIRAVGPLATASTQRTRFDLIFSFNTLEAMHRLKIY